MRRRGSLQAGWRVVWPPQSPPHGQKPPPEYDIDFGIAVENWAQFELLQERPLATNEFSASRAQQRLIFAESNEGLSLPVEFIPFRGVASAHEIIAWPPNRDIVVIVAGCEEALASSVLIEIEVDLIVHVASAAGLTLLKLAAWVDRGRESNKDAADLYRLLTSYADAWQYRPPVRRGIRFTGNSGFRHAIGGCGASRS